MEDYLLRRCLIFSVFAFLCFESCESRVPGHRRRTTPIYGRRWLEECSAEEAESWPCYNGGLCLVVEFIDGTTTLLCACPAGWEGVHCELQTIEDYFDYSLERRSSSLTRVPGKLNINALSNACNALETQITNCQNGICFAMYISGRTRRPFCNCRVGWTGEQCEMRHIDYRTYNLRALRVLYELIGTSNN